MLVFIYEVYMLSFLGKTCRRIISVNGNRTETIDSLYCKGSLGMFALVSVYIHPT